MSKTNKSNKSSKSIKNAKVASTGQFQTILPGFLKGSDPEYNAAKAAFEKFLMPCSSILTSDLTQPAVALFGDLPYGSVFGFRAKEDTTKPTDYFQKLSQRRALKFSLMPTSAPVEQEFKKDAKVSPVPSMTYMVRPEFLGVNIPPTLKASTLMEPEEKEQMDKALKALKLAKRNLEMVTKRSNQIKAAMRKMPKDSKKYRAIQEELRKLQAQLPVIKEETTPPVVVAPAEPKVSTPALKVLSAATPGNAAPAATKPVTPAGNKAAPKPATKAAKAKTPVKKSSKK